MGGKPNAADRDAQPMAARKVLVTSAAITAGLAALAAVAAVAGPSIWREIKIMRM